jgi:hypothetical protein
VRTLCELNVGLKAFGRLNMKPRCRREFTRSQSQSCLIAKHVSLEAGGAVYRYRLSEG